MKSENHITLVTIHNENSPHAIALGSAMIKAVLDSSFRKQLSSQVLEFYPNESPLSIAEEIIKTDCTAAGFSLYLWNTQTALEAVACIRKLKPEMIIFCGGAEPSGEPERFSENLFDFVINGEGEDLIIEVAGDLLKGKNRLKKIYRNIKPVNLKKLPSPYLNGIINIKEKKSALWELSRGCPFKCSFCFESRNIDKVRYFPLSRIKKELRYFKKSGVNQIFILDPTFNYERKRTAEILDMLIKKSGGIHFSIEIRSEFIDEKQARLFSKLNCSLQIGLQSAADKVLKNINRSINREFFSEKINLLNKYGAVFGFDLIYGLPGDSIETFKESLDYALSLQPNHLDIFPLSVLPGTKLKELAFKQGVKYSKESPYTVTETETMSCRDMSSAYKLKKGVDYFYNTGSAGWFLPVLRLLNITPSDFIEKWSDFTSAYDNISVSHMKKAFIETLFADEDINLKYAVNDLIKLHECLNKALSFNNSEDFIEETFYFNPDSLSEITSSETDDFDEDCLSCRPTLKTFSQIYNPGEYKVIFYKTSCGSAYEIVS